MMIGMPNRMNNPANSIKMRSKLIFLQNVELVRPLPATAEDELGVKVCIRVKRRQHSGW
jgi:hypothetical protein